MNGEIATIGYVNTVIGSNLLGNENDGCTVSRYKQLSNIVQPKSTYISDLELLRRTDVEKETIVSSNSLEIIDIYPYHSIGWKLPSGSTYNYTNQYLIDLYPGSNTVDLAFSRNNIPVGFTVTIGLGLKIETFIPNLQDSNLQISYIPEPQNDAMVGYCESFIKFSDIPREIVSYETALGEIVLAFRDSSNNLIPNTELCIRMFIVPESYS